MLVQVLEILEIGRPAHELLKLHRDKVEDRKIFSEQGRAVIRAVTDVGPTQDGTGNDTQDPNALGESDSKAFPRAMLRLRVSDGFNEYVAIETKKIRDLNMDETPLGCKVMYIVSPMLPFILSDTWLVHPAAHAEECALLARNPHARRDVLHCQGRFAA